MSLSLSLSLTHSFSLSPPPPSPPSLSLSLSLVQFVLKTLCEGIWKSVYAILQDSFSDRISPRGAFFPLSIYCTLCFSPNGKIDLALGFSVQNVFLKEIAARHRQGELQAEGGFIALFLPISPSLYILSLFHLNPPSFLSPLLIKFVFIILSHSLTKKNQFIFSYFIILKRLNKRLLFPYVPKVFFI